MRRFIVEFLLFVLLQVALLAGLFGLFSDLRRVSPFMPALEIKQKRLETSQPPRLILIGGSNLFFGIDSPMIEAQTDFAAVNMGLLRGLRLEYILNQIDAQLRAGDLVVISLEYSTLNGDSMGEEGQLIVSATTRRLANVRLLTWPQWRAMLDHDAAEYLGMVFRQSIQRISESRRQEGPGIEGEVNEFGDLTMYHGAAATAPADNDNDQRTLVRVRPEGVKASTRRMNTFIASCRERNVDVMFAWPPISRSHYDERAAFPIEFDRLLRSHLEAPVIGTPADMVFDDDDFIGRSYHLRGAGVQKRTQRLIDAVKMAIQGKSQSGLPSEK